MAQPKRLQGLAGCIKWPTVVDKNLLLQGTGGDGAEQALEFGLALGAATRWKRGCSSSNMQAPSTKNMCRWMLRFSAELSGVGARSVGVATGPAGGGET